MVKTGQINILNLFYTTISCQKFLENRQSREKNFPLKKWHYSGLFKGASIKIGYELPEIFELRKFFSEKKNWMTFCAKSTTPPTKEFSSFFVQLFKMLDIRNSKIHTKKAWNSSSKKNIRTLKPLLLGFWK